MAKHPEHDLVADYACVVGESPVWHPDEKRIYWLDVVRGHVYRYDPQTKYHECCYQGQAVGGLTVQRDGSLLLLMAKGAVRIWRDTYFEVVVKDLPEERDSQFNDAIADPAGRVFAGTLPSPGHAGRLYRLETDGRVATVLENIGGSNGMGFSLDGKTMYYTDSSQGVIYRFSYERTTGSLTDQRVFAAIPSTFGVPDGMTVDAEDHVWSAVWGGGCVVRFSPSGELCDSVPLPVANVTSLTFGGPGYADMYVTTAGGQDKVVHGPGAGALFRITPSVRGVPENRSAVSVPFS